MARNRSRYEIRNISQLDVTPLVDLTFLLLIVFMITAPAFENATDLTAPEKDANEMPPPEKAFLISINNRGEYIMKEELLPKAEIEIILKQLYQSKPDNELLIRSDQGRPLGEVVELWRIGEGVGFKVSLVTAREN